MPPADEPSDCVFIPGGQFQTGDNFEAMGSAAYRHMFSANTIGWLRFMARDNSNDFYSNPASWPVIATQHNDFKEIYFSGSGSVHHGNQEWKAGVESDAIILERRLQQHNSRLRRPQTLSAPSRWEFWMRAHQPSAFTGSRPDLEQSAYVQDSIRLGNWTVNAGLRWDHYQLLLNQNAVSPRVAMSRFFPTLGSIFTDRTIASSRHLRLKTSSYPVLWLRSRSTPAFPRCNCRSSLLTEVTTNWA